MVAERRIISADSHVTIPKEMVHQHLPQKLREAVAESEAAYVAQMLEAKPQKTKRNELKEEPKSFGGLPNMGKGAPWPAAGRAGESDPVEPVKDMDIDGVAAEILYIASRGASPASLDS